MFRSNSSENHVRFIPTTPTVRAIAGDLNETFTESHTLVMNWESATNCNFALRIDGVWHNTGTYARKTPAGDDLVPNTPYSVKSGDAMISFRYLDGSYWAVAIAYIK